MLNSAGSATTCRRNLSFVSRVCSSETSRARHWSGRYSPPPFERPGGAEARAEHQVTASTSDTTWWDTASNRLWRTSIRTQFAVSTIVRRTGGSASRRCRRRPACSTRSEIRNRSATKRREALAPPPDVAGSLRRGAAERPPTTFGTPYNRYSAMIFLHSDDFYEN